MVLKFFQWVYELASLDLWDEQDDLEYCCFVDQVMIDLECWNIAGDTAHQKISELVRKKLDSFDRKNYDDEKEWDGVKEEDKKMEEEEEGLSCCKEEGDNKEAE